MEKLSLIFYALMVTFFIMYAYSALCYVAFLCREIQCQSNFPKTEKYHKKAYLFLVLSGISLILSALFALI